MADGFTEAVHDAINLDLCLSLRVKGTRSRPAAESSRMITVLS